MYKLQKVEGKLMFVEKDQVEQCFLDQRLHRDEVWEQAGVNAYLRLQDMGLFIKEIEDDLITFSKAEAQRRNFSSIYSELHSTPTEEQWKLFRLIGQLDKIFFRVKCPYCQDIAYTSRTLTNPPKVIAIPTLCRRCGRLYSGLYNLTDEEESSAEFVIPQEHKITEENDIAVAENLLGMKALQAGSGKNELKVCIGWRWIVGIYVFSWLFVCLCFSIYQTMSSRCDTTYMNLYILTGSFGLAAFITWIVQKRKRRTVMLENQEAMAQEQINTTPNTTIDGAKFYHNLRAR